MSELTVKYKFAAAALILPGDTTTIAAALQRFYQGDQEAA